MELEYIPIFLENEKNGIANGNWIHYDANINMRILPIAYTSDIGILSPPSAECCYKLIKFS